MWVQFEFGVILMGSDFAWVKASWVGVIFGIFIVGLGVEDVVIDSKVWNTVVFGPVITGWWVLILGATWAVADWITSHMHVCFSLGHNYMWIIFNLITWVINKSSLDIVAVWWWDLGLSPEWFQVFWGCGNGIFACWVCVRVACWNWCLLCKSFLSLKMSIFSFLEFHFFWSLWGIILNSDNLWDWWWQFNVSANIMRKSMINIFSSVFPWGCGFSGFSSGRVEGWNWV